MCNMHNGDLKFEEESGEIIKQVTPPEDKQQGISKKKRKDKQAWSKIHHKEDAADSKKKIGVSSIVHIDVEEWINNNNKWHTS